MHAKDSPSRLGRPVTFVSIALTAVGGAAAIGATTNALNAWLCPGYYRRVLRWEGVRDIWRAAVAQGVFEGLLYGALFAVVFTLAVGNISRGKASYGFAAKHLMTAAAVALFAWALGGALGMGLVALSPEFYQRHFRVAPEGFNDMVAFAWVGGSIWGVLFGAVLGAVVSVLSAGYDWRSQAT